mmetsp:Transcript_1902/g.3381  ORF Transcript_1902/g.3381 Transcript_1902/m.3381 type:complete len:702 (-) Transcript_1902:70-2175(-)
MAKMFLIALVLGALPCLCSAATCEAADGDCPAWQTSEQQALVQTKRLQLQKVNKHNVAPQEEEEADDPIEDEADQHELAVTRLAGKLAALQTNTLVQDLKVTLSDDGGRASVSFVSAGESHEYKMEAVSAYTAEANISIWTGSTWEYMHPGQPRTFRSHEDGKYASARINEDNSVDGLFERPDGQVLDVRPIDHHDSEDPAHPLLLEYTGQGRAHVSAVVTDIVESHLSTAAMTDERDPTPEEEFSTTTPYHPAHDEEMETMPHPKVGQEPPRPPSAFNKGAPWTGTKWYPGCYKGDDKMNILSMGFTIPPTIFRNGKSRAYTTVDIAKARWEQHLTKASFIYEKQMNIRLALGDVKVAQAGGPKWALTHCPSDGWDGIMGHLKGLEKSIIEKEVPFQASWHTWVNCAGEYGVMGLGYVGTLCKATQGYNSGSDKFHSPASWMTFTHELGHNFAGKHTFEEGQGKTGGVMDYGDGKLRGVYQFHTRYRKTEMCKHLQDTRDCPAFRMEGEPPPPPYAERPPCQTKKHPGMYSGGYAGGFSKGMDLQEAIWKCVDLKKFECAAVTCPRGKTTGCTVRAGAKLGNSRGEDSYTIADYTCCAKDCKAGGGGAPPPPPPPSPPPGSGSGSGSPSPPGSGSGSGSSRRRRAPSSGSGGGGSGPAPSPPAPPPAPAPTGGNTEKLEKLEKRFEKIQGSIEKIETKLR